MQRILQQPERRLEERMSVAPYHLVEAQSYEGAAIIQRRTISKVQVHIHMYIHVHVFRAV